MKVHVFPQEYFSWDTKDPQGVLQAWIDNQPEWTYLTSRDGLCSLSPCQLRVLGTEEKGVIIEETGLALLCLSKMREMGLIINPQPIEFSLHEVLVELGQVIEHTKTRAAYPFTHGISAIPLHKTRMWVTLRTMIRVHDFWFWWKHQASHTARVFFLAEVLHNRTDNELATLANYDYPLAFEQSRALLPEEIEALIRAYNEYRQ